MSPFEVLYGHKCITPLNLAGVEDKVMLGPNMLKEMEYIVKNVHLNLKTTQDQ